MDKPDLLGTILETMVSNPPPKGFKPKPADIQKIVQLCEEFKFVSTNRTDCRTQINQIVNEILARGGP